MCAARIDDDDPEFMDDDWQRESARHAVTYPLRAYRWWSVSGELDEDADGRCLGIRSKISMRVHAGGWT